MACSEVDPHYFSLPVLDNRFTSAELDELLSYFKPTENARGVDKSSEPLSSSNSGSDNSTNQGSITGSGEEMDERKEKRKKSNRESARKSRLRKKRYIENLTAQVNRLKTQNREYINRLTFALNQLHAVNTQNESLRFESVCLIERHAELNRILQFTRNIQRKNNMVTDSMNYRRFVVGNEPLFG